LRTLFFEKGFPQSLVGNPGEGEFVKADSLSTLRKDAISAMIRR
jgi:hypothetical protein